MKDHSTWYRIRRDMFEQLMTEVRSREGEEGPEMARYRRAYDADVSRPWRSVHREDLFRRAARAPLLLLGDFHALAQSQRGHLRVLEGLASRNAEPLVLAVECIRTKHQKAVDAYLRGDLGDDEFLRRVRWRAEWGFPWEHYRPLFEWARRHRCPVFALNSGEGSLLERDRAAAERIGEIRAKLPSHRIVVIYGDLHLQKNGLPRELARVLGQRPLRIFQNAEEPYFRLLRRKRDHAVEVIRYDGDSFAILNVAPWVKWQNYLLWRQHAWDPRLAEEADPTDAVAALVKWLGGELGVKVDAGELTVYGATERELWRRIRDDVPARARPWVQLLIEDGRSFYLSSAGWGYLAKPSVNHAAALAMQFVHDRLCGGASVTFRMPADFPRLIWIEAIAFFGTKLINPKRKSNTLRDLHSSLSSRQANDRGKEALRLALSQKMREINSREGGVTSFRPRHRASWVAASHLLGALAGERLSHGFRRGLIGEDRLRALLAEPVASPKFALIYDELIEIIDALPAPFRSKKEKL